MLTGVAAWVVGNRGRLVAKPFFVSEFSSSMDAVSETLKEALRALIDRGWVDVDQRFYAHLCLEEALVNAVDHGNKRDTSKKVRIEMVEDDQACVIRVYDEGGGFSPNDIGMPKLEQLNGRGICLIRYCMDSVTYNQEKRCLEMRMRRKALCQKESRHD